MKTKNYARWIGLLWLVILIVACGQARMVEIPAVGDIVVESYDLDGFNQVEVEGFFEAEISQGEGYQVVVEAERALMSYLEIDVRGDRLQVGLKSGINYSFEDASQRVEVTLPALTRARVGNHSALRLDGFEVEGALQLEVVDFSTLLGSIEAKEIQVEVSNHSSLILVGSVLRVTGAVTGFSSADLTRLDAEDVDLAVDEQSSLKE